MKIPEFKSKIAKDRKTSCWNWIGAKLPRGYGQLRFAGGYILAHRLSWKLFRGTIPEGLFVLHRCDNPSCCNPDHLFIGNQSDNMRDARSKNRVPKLLCEKNPQSKLTAKQAIAIFTDARSAYQLARVYGVNSKTIWAIKHRQTWTSVTAGIL